MPTGLRPQRKRGTSHRGPSRVGFSSCGVLFPLLFALLLCGQHAEAQAAAEYSKTTSATATAAQAGQARPARVPAKKQVFAHLPLGSQREEAAEMNRRELLKDAGEQPAVVLVRSQPSGSHVWLDGKLVGETPLLLVVPPGQHGIELRGARLSRAQKVIRVGPEEKKEFLLSLQPRYPAQVKLP